MIIWGAIWGALLSLSFGENAWIFGIILGVIAGLTLRQAIRTEISKALKAAQLVRRSAPEQQAASTDKINATPLSPAVTAPSPAAPFPAPSPQIVPLALSVPSMEAGINPTVPVNSPTVQPTKTLLPKVPPAFTASSQLPPLRSSNPTPPDPIGKAFSAIFNWLTGGNTVVRIGIVVLFFGLSFLAKYAADNQMFPIELRLSLVGLAGIALLAVGFRLRTQREGYAMTLQGAGVAVLYLTVFASFRVYGLLEHGLVLALMVAICTLSTAIALLQNAKALAVIGFAGGFLAPILMSTGQGNHVVLFSYYALLNVAILFIALRRSWRVLNLTGFFLTFGVATVWGVLRYTPEHLASTEPFLILFFFIYVLTAVLYALRQAPQIKGSMQAAVDGTLVFGTPLVAFGLQAAMVQHIEFAMAFSALSLGAFYLLLAMILLKRKQDSLKLLTECFLALGTGFATLAVPLALDARWTTAVWAVEGAGVFWVGMRQARWMPRAFGLALQGIAALAFLSSMEQGSIAALPFANPAFIGALLLSLPAFAIAWWTRQALDHSGSAFANSYAHLEKVISKPAFLVGFFWWLSAFTFEIQRLVPNGTGMSPAIDTQFHANLMMLLFVLSAFVAERIAKRTDWSVASWPAYITTPILLLTALVNIGSSYALMGPLGWAFWLVALGAHGVLLRRMDTRNPVGWFAWMHALGVWVLVILLADTLVFAINQGNLWRTAWASVVLLVAGTAVLLCLAILPGSKRWAGRWPFVEEERFIRSYTWLAAVPLAIIVFFGALLVALRSSGNADPLPYIPLLNPTDLSVALGLGAIALWLLKLSRTKVNVPAEAFGNAPKIALSLAAFIALNTVWLRVAHHFGGVAWNAHALFRSFWVQTGYAILWTVLALVLMMMAHRKKLRILWLVGAGLLGLTLAKLFLIDLSNSGGSARIVAFIVVGVLMLVVGYVAPLPPKQQPSPEAAKPTEPTEPAQAENM